MLLSALKVRPFAKTKPSLADEKVKALLSRSNSHNRTSVFLYKIYLRIKYSFGMEEPTGGLGFSNDFVT